MKSIYHTYRFCGHGRLWSAWGAIRTAWRDKMARRALRRILYEYF